MSSEIFPPFYNAGNGIYYIRQKTTQPEFRQELNRIIGDFCSFTIGNECENFQNDLAEKLSGSNFENPFITCREYYAFQVENTVDSISSPDELIAYFNARGPPLAMASITIKNTNATAETVNSFEYLRPYEAWIYALCKNPTVTTKNFTKNFVKNMQRTLGETNLKIGVNLTDESSWEKLVKTYLKYGFINPRVERVNTWQNGVKTGEIWSCTMDSMDRSYSDKEQKDALKQLKEIRDLTYTAAAIETIPYTYFFPPSIYLALRNFLYLDHEYAGGIDSPVLITDYPSNSTIELMLRKLTTSARNCSVFFENDSNTQSIVEVHTHPLYCYVKAQYVIGTPSMEDWARVIFTLQNGTYINQVIAWEGVYTYFLTEPFKLFILSLVNNTNIGWPKIVAAFTRNIKLTMGQAESMRKKPDGTPWTNADTAMILEGRLMDTPEIVEKRQELLSITRNFRLSNLLYAPGGFRTVNPDGTEEDVPELNRLASLTDFRLFEIGFVDYATVLQSGITLTDLIGFTAPSMEL